MEPSLADAAAAEAFALEVFAVALLGGDNVVAAGLALAL